MEKIRVSKNRLCSNLEASGYLSLSGKGVAVQIKVKKSVFVAHIGKISTRAEILEFVRQIKKNIVQPIIIVGPMFLAIL